MGIAVGCIGMRPGDFELCYFDEFEAISRAWHDMQDGESRNAWERMRTLAAISIQPHLKKSITPGRLLPLPWDKRKPDTPASPEAPVMSPEERKRRFEELAARFSG